MLRVMLAFMIGLTTVSWAQENASQFRGAGCGSDEAKFYVKRDTHSHPAGTPESGKALVYVFGDSELDHTSFHVGGFDTRVGIDGEWVGAYGYKSYTYFPVSPGEHRMCTSQQSSIKSRRDETATAITFTAEAGKVYYFRTQPSPRALAQSTVSGVPTGGVELAKLDPAQAQLMIPKWAFSSSQPKK